MSTGVAPSPQEHALRRHEVMTPEGVSLRFDIAPAGDRVAAFLVDMAVIIVLIIAIVLTAGAATWGGTGGGDWLWALVLLAIFLLWAGYFIWFESRGRGTTPGKRRLGLRIMDVDGGALTVQAVVVRNVMRVLELQVPLIALLAPQAIWPGAPDAAVWIASLWMILVTGLPLFNRRRQRAGDLVAGTIVVVAPDAVLEGDVTDDRIGRRVREVEERFTFTDAQLDVYGEHELHVLEDVLRRADNLPDARRVISAVTNRIVRKIGYPQRVGPRQGRIFLAAFYAALRVRLEKRMLLGKRKRDQHSREA